MKKLPLLCILSFVFCIGITFGYSSEDTSNANYLADQGIVTKQTTASKYRLDDKILRQEVIGMALKVKGITLPENYTCKKYFTDATKNDWVCRAVELAADNGIISRSNKYANPGKDVTRAEALAMVMKAGGKSLELFNAGGITIDSSVVWQQNVFISAYIAGIISPEDIFNKSNEEGPYMHHIYRPNSLATRAEVFAFARNILSPINNKYTVELLNNPENKFPDEPKILYLKEGDNTIEIDRGYLGNPVILGDLLIYEWTLTGGTMIRIFSLKTMEMINAVAWGEVSSDNRYIFGCFAEMSCVIFSVEKQRTIYTTDLDPLSSEYGELKYLGEDRFILPDKKVVDFSKVSPLIDAEFILSHYYWLINQGSLKTAFAMRSPSGMTYDKFESLYRNFSTTIESYDNSDQTWERRYNNIELYSDLKNLGNNTYEFSVYTDEGGVKSTYKVKSKVNLEKFTIDNISSVKQ